MYVEGEAKNEPKRPDDSRKLREYRNEIPHVKMEKII